MKFGKFAEYLEKLEGTGSRLEMTRILALMFGEMEPEEGKIAAYMSQGMLGPKYNNPDVGMADKQVLKAIQRLSDEDAEKVFKQEGDMGLAVQKIKSQITNHKLNSKFEIREIHKQLLEIAEAGGDGSQDKKINLLSDLVIKLSPKEAKYAVKIVLGKMRSGFSDMTVLDSLSWMLTGDKTLRGAIEKIYNVRADLGETVRLVRAKGAEVQRVKVDPEVGTPILVARAERAKSPKEIWDRLGVAAAEHKLDGLRIQAHVKPETGKQKSEIKLFSRGMENVTNMYPDIVEGLKTQIHKECILDGEMIAVGENGKYLPFQETVQRKRKYDILEMMAQVPLKYYVFDVLAAEGKSYLDKKNEERWEKLELLVNSNRDTVRLMPRIMVHSEKEIEDFFYKALKEGTEGIVVKKLSGIYQSGSRDFNWIKYKKSYDESGVVDTIDAVVMGYDYGQGKRQGFGIGGFLIGVQKGDSGKFQTIAKIGTGLKDDEWKYLKTECEKLKTEHKPENYEISKQMECDVWVKPGIVVEIKCDEITVSPMHTAGFALRFPRLVSFREMKMEEIATTAEIKRLYTLGRKGGDK
jgi:DNA ligase 1